MIGALLLGLIAGVDPQLPAYRAPPAALAGHLTVSGGPLMRVWAAGFQRANPGVQIAVVKPAADSMDDLRALQAGQIQIASNGFQREREYLASLGHPSPGPPPFVIAFSSGGTTRHPNMPESSPALAIYVNRANPLSGLTLDQLDAIFSLARKRGYPNPITTWGQLGLSGDWARQPIHRYGMVLKNQFGSPHGYVYFLMQRMLGGGEFDPALVQVPDTAFGSGANYAFVQVVQDVANDRYGIAFAPFEFAAAGAKTLALAETAGAPFYAGTRDEVARRVYPLTMTNYLSARPPVDPVVREFFKYVLSRQGQQAVAALHSHLVPLPAGFATQERAKLREAVPTPPPPGPP